MRSDYRAILFLLILLVGLVLVFVVVDHSVTLENGDDSKDSVSQAADKDPQQRYYSDYAISEHKLQPFDPNTADSTLLLSLGLPEWMVRGIYKYRAKGGSYSSVEDFARTPGLTKKQYRELKPYIRISDDYRPASELVSNVSANKAQESMPSDGEKYPMKISGNERIDVNTADTSQLKTVPGIGSYYARKIVERRKQLGGFISRDQLLAIKGFPEASLEYLVIPDGGIKKLNINTADFTTLNSHPYISYQQTKDILNYRRLKGKIKSFKDLSLVKSFSEEDFKRLEPYIEF